MPPETLASTIAATDSPNPVRVATFRAMGTDVRVLGPASTPAARFDPIAGMARDLFERLEQRFSHRTRFPKSLLTTVHIGVPSTQAPRYSYF